MLVHERAGGARVSARTRRAFAPRPRGAFANSDRTTQKVYQYSSYPKAKRWQTLPSAMQHSWWYSGRRPKTSNGHRADRHVTRNFPLSELAPIIFYVLDFTGIPSHNLYHPYRVMPCWQISDKPSGRLEYRNRFGYSSHAHTHMIIISNQPWPKMEHEIPEV